MSEVPENSTSNKLILNIAGILSIFLILSLNINVFYWADDYSIMNEINDFGIFKRCVNGFYTWDGRYLTPAAFLQGFFLSALPVGIITLFWNLCFLASGIYMYFILKEENNTIIISRSSIYLPLLFAIAFWLGSYKHITQTIYWATGGVYSFNLLLGAVWLFWFYKIQKSEAFLSRAMFLFSTIFIGLTTQNLTIGLMTLLLLTIINDTLKKENKNQALNVLLLLIILGGTIFLSTAPGNFIRIKEINNSSLTDISIWQIAKNLCIIAFAYLKVILLMLPIAISVGIVCLTEKGRTISTAFRKIVVIPRTKAQIIVFIEDYKYLLAALSTILPLVTIPGVASERTSIYFMFFLFLFIVKFISLFGVTASKKTGIFSVLLPYAVFFITICFTVYNFQKGTMLKSEITKRENILKKSANKTVRINIIDESLKSHCYDFRDFRGNDDWAVEAQEDYFGITKIVVE